MNIIKGQLVDIPQRYIYGARVTIDEGKIMSVQPDAVDAVAPFILPGFIDAHVHIESAMLVPSQFARLAVVHGTVATVSDPHEIANVCGLEGISYMLADAKTVPFKFNFGAPSCVPATQFETAGARLGVAEVEALLQQKEIRYLSEMMNFPGVLQQDPEVMAKIAAAKRLHKPVDGHAPGLRGEEARRYIAAGISTDHECFTEAEALEKLQYGMHILIREGSAAKNFDALAGLLHHHAGRLMFCSDDKHPDSLVAGHINKLCARAVAAGIDPFHILQAACINPVRHYGLEAGLLRPGDPADFILVNNLSDFDVVQTWINGQLVAENGATAIGGTNGEQHVLKPVNRFNCSPKTPEDFAIYSNGEVAIRVIAAMDGQLVTLKENHPPKITANAIVSDTERDILKIAVVNRYENAPVAKAFARNFGLRHGAIASSVAHDSHNIVAVGADDASLCRAVNAVIEQRGGISCVCDEKEMVLPLPVAGLMSNEDGYTVAEAYTAIDAMAKSLGSTLSAPFMTLSFMALLVIPHLKLSDKGLFDGDNFSLLQY